MLKWIDFIDSTFRPILVTKQFVQFRLNESKCRAGILAVSFSSSSKLEPSKENEIVNIHGVACKHPPVHGRWEVVQYSGWAICGKDSGI